MHERQKEQARAYHVVHLLVLVASSTQKYAQSNSNRVTKVDSFRWCECVNDECMTCMFGLVCRCIVMKETNICSMELGLTTS